MIYSIWAVFFLLILGLLYKTRGIGKEYLRKKAEEQQKAILDALVKKVEDEAMKSERKTRSVGSPCSRDS
jgi:hypothetical protein